MSTRLRDKEIFASYSIYLEDVRPVLAEGQTTTWHQLRDLLCLLQQDDEPENLQRFQMNEGHRASKDNVGKLLYLNQRFKFRVFSLVRSYSYTFIYQCSQTVFQNKLGRTRIHITLSPPPHYRSKSSSPPPPPPPSHYRSKSSGNVEQAIWWEILLVIDR